MNNIRLVDNVVTSVAGDQEREAKSRRYNLTEGLGVMVFIMFILWGVAYPFGVMGEINGIREVSTWMLILGAVYILFVSPFIHKDTLCTWGLGSPWKLREMLREGSPAKRLMLGLLLLALFLGLNALNYLNWGEVSEFFNFDKTPAKDFDKSFPGILVVFGFGSALSAVIVLFGIRYDNFLSAFATAMKIALPLLALIILGAVAQRGAHAFDGFTFRRFFTGAFGYVFWGFVQQLLFSAYMGTRVRKAFGPATAPDNARPAGTRLPVALRFGAGFALVGAPLFYLPLLAHFGAETIPLKLLFFFALFFAPLGVLYGHYYAVDRKRLLVATLSGSCFGLIHINSWGLVAVTFLLGVFLSYVFMVERNRNLVALGFIHGLLGSSFSLFFSDGKSGALEVDYGVGPWNVDNPAWGVMFVPVVCMLAYLFIIRCYLKNAHEEA